MKEKYISPTHSFEVEDAVRFGSIEKALIFKEIGSFIVYKIRNNKSPWVYYSSDALSQKFPYLSRESIRRWLRELEYEDKELVSTIRNTHAYDQTKSYTFSIFKDIDFDSSNSNPSNKTWVKYQEMRQKLIGQKHNMVGQNDHYNGQNGATIPPLPSSLSEERKPDGFHPPGSLERIEGGDEFGDVSEPKYKEPLTKHPEVAKIWKRWSELCEKNLDMKPVRDIKSLKMIKFALNTGGLTEAKIYDLFDEWFQLGKPDEETISIGRALSGRQIEQYKIRNARS